MAEEVLKIDKLTKIYDFEGTDINVVLEDVSFSLYGGETLGIIGESGSGKSILARCIGARGRPTSGKIILMGENITKKKMKFLVKRTQRKIQTIFQVPNQSFELDTTIGKCILDALKTAGVKGDEAKKKVNEMLETVGLDPDCANMFPYEVSGGQCQRAAIAKALSVNPKVMIFDEALSSLDASSQINIMELLKREKEKRGMSYLFISHDMKLVEQMCDRVLVLKK